MYDRRNHGFGRRESVLDEMIEVDEMEDILDGDFGDALEDELLLDII